MSGCQRLARPAARLLRPGRFAARSSIRSFSQTARRRDEPTLTETSPSSPDQLEAAAAAAREAARAAYQEKLLNRETTTAQWAERRLVRSGTPPIGSRRRRAAIRSSPNIPFEQLPYQCFQEARKILIDDRKAKLQAIAAEMAKIKRLEDTPAEKLPGGQGKKQMRLTSMRKHLEDLKILADINDPVVKMRFEDGHGDMNKPIYRHLAEQKWRGYPYRLLTQRLTQMHLVPDVLPAFEPRVDVQLYFRRTHVTPGEIVESRVSEVPPRLRVQVFDAGERLVSVVVLDSDVPNATTDSFDRRCHYLAANVPLAPDRPSLPLGQVDREAQLALPWLPAFAQKGAPYHRLSVWVLQQPPGRVLDVAQLRALYAARDGFSLKSFRDKFGLAPVGFNLFRSVWDARTAAVMQRAGLPGADVEFRPKRVHSLKPPRRQRGWEAKRAKPKYRSLWKYSHRIRGIPRRGW